MPWYDIAREIAPWLQQGDIDRCIERVTRELQKLPDSPFHTVATLEFTNKPKDIARYFEEFISNESKRIPIKAVYTETNGFDINPDRWFFDVFAYKTYGGHDDHDWLSDWQSDRYPDMTLTGMERLQEIYETEYVVGKSYGDSPDYASLLVVLKFQNLIKSSAPLISNLSFPLLATSHEYDLIYEFTVTDPTWYTTTWKGRNRLRRSSETLFEFACHEGNYAIRFILQGMRAREL